MADIEITDEERAYMVRPLTDAEKAATKGLPPMVVQGWIRASRAQELANKRAADRKEKITEAFVALMEAVGS